MRKRIACLLSYLLIVTILFMSQSLNTLAGMPNKETVLEGTISENTVFDTKHKKDEAIQETMTAETLEKSGETDDLSDAKKPMRVYVPEGERSYNVNLNHYETTSQPIYSSLYENEFGGLTRAEYIGDKFIVENYNDSFELVKKNTVNFQTNTVFGGFYHGEQYNYIMLGHTDADMEKGIPQYELQIFDSVFTLVDTIEVNGVNSNPSQPFGATNVRFEELDDFLYVRTGHVLGKYDSQAGHQENLYFIFDTAARVLLYMDDTWEGVEYGDVGHTLNRFLKINNGYFYIAEQQDFNPGGVYLFKLPFLHSVKEPLDYTMAIPMYCNSYVMVSADGTIGGMEISEDNVLIAGSYKNKGSNEWERNIFVSVAPGNGQPMTSEVIYLTDYEIGSRVVATTPQMIKISDNRFLVLWTNYYIPDKEGNIYYSDCEKDTSYLFIDGDGHALSDVMKIDVPMSECQPIVYDNNIVWYYTDYSAPMFIQIPADGSEPIWNPTGADYYEVIVNYPENSQSYSYAYGSEVNLTPKYISGKRFDHWEIVSENIDTYETKEDTLKFIMPAGTVTVSAIYEENENTGSDSSDTGDESIEKYNVSFFKQNGEVGDGDYEPGETVTISADTSTPTRRFREWHSVYVAWDGFQTKTSPTTTFVMPNCDVEIQALYDYGHTVTVESGNGDGVYFEGDVVTIKADDIEGKRFAYWYFTDKYGRDSFASPYDMFEPITAFEMIDEPVVIKAVYESNTIINDNQNNNEGNNNISNGNENPTPQLGMQITDNESSAMYTITSSDLQNPTVSYDGTLSESDEKIIIPDYITYNGMQYKVTTVSIQSFEDSESSGKYKVTDNRINNLSVTYTGTTDKKKKTISIPGDVTYQGIKYKVTSVDAKAFKNNKKITTVKIGDQITKIGNSAFEGCTKLKSVTIGKKLKSIGKNAFKNCKKLNKLTIKSSKLTSVGKNALKGINAKCKIKVPAKKVKSYQKLFKGKGQKKGVKVTK